MRQKEANIGERMTTKNAEYRGYRRAEESLFHILKECDAAKNDMSIEEFIEEEGKGLELMKKIKKLREEITNVNWKEKEGEE